MAQLLLPVFQVQDIHYLERQLKVTVEQLTTSYHLGYSFGLRDTFQQQQNFFFVSWKLR